MKKIATTQLSEEMKLKLAGIVRMLCHVLSVTGGEGGQLTDEIVDLRSGG